MASRPSFLERTASRLANDTNCPKSTHVKSTNSTNVEILPPPPPLLRPVPPLPQLLLLPRLPLLRKLPPRNQGFLTDGLPPLPPHLLPHPLLLLHLRPRQPQRQQLF